MHEKKNACRAGKSLDPVVKAVNNDCQNSYAGNVNGKVMNHENSDYLGDIP